jgi:isoquinoline 1-oxidoreductase subunit beta
VPGFARDVAAAVAGVGKDDVTVIVTYLGGGFGRRLEVDFIAQAVRVALECNGRPVQLLWSREEDMTHDFYRPAAVAQLRAVLADDGKPQALAIHSAGDAITPRWMARGLPALAGPVDTPDKTAAEGLFDLPYAIAHQRMTHEATRMGVPIGFWRAVGHSHNAFLSEGFMDELAHAAQQDPVAYRLALLDKMPRHAAVLKLAADKAGWGQPLPAGRARGVALHESFDSIVAEVVEVSLDGPDKKWPRVHRVVVAIDCGAVINPGIVAQQMESGVVFALTAALHGKVDIQNSIVKQRNFPDYPLVAMKDAPRVETHVVPSERHPGGVGEVAVPPLAPALGNALFVLTGQRLRELPLSLS